MEGPEELARADAGGVRRRRRERTRLGGGAPKRLVDGFRKVREEIEAFKPDFVLIWGDDQYENFHEDLVPPFSVYLCDQYETQPFHKRRFTADGDEISNVWGEDFDHVFKHAGHPEAAKLLATRLLQMGYPMPYAYKTLHYQGLPHAFLNTLLFLDYDRKGFDFPVIPFTSIATEAPS